MANIGDKSFTTQMVGAIESVIENTIGNDAGTNRFTAQVMAVDYVNSTVDVRLPGTSVDSTGFTVNGTQMPVIGDYVIVYINQSERWVDTVYRTATSSPYLSVVSGSLNAYGTNNFGAPTGAVVSWLTTTAPSGWLFCNGATVSRTTYANLFAVIGTNFGAGDGSTTFGLPNLQDRFLAGQSSTGTQPAVNSGSLAPNTAWSTGNHQHTVDIDHGHGFNAGAHTHEMDLLHTHSQGTGSTADMVGSINRQTLQDGNISIPNLAHTHGMGSSASYTTSNALSNNRASDAAVYSTNASVTNLNNTTNPSTTSVSATVGTAKSFLSNFIIKT